MAPVWSHRRESGARTGPPELRGASQHPGSVQACHHLRTVLVGEVAVTVVQAKVNTSDTFSWQKSFNNMRMGKERRQKSIDSQRVKSGPSALCGARCWPNRVGVVGRHKADTLLVSESDLQMCQGRLGMPWLAWGHILVDVGERGGAALARPTGVGVSPWKC